VTCEGRNVSSSLACDKLWRLTHRGVGRRGYADSGSSNRLCCRDSVGFSGWHWGGDEAGLGRGLIAGGRGRNELCDC
jgi:hypothetical protein